MKYALCHILSQHFSICENVRSSTGMKFLLVSKSRDGFVDKSRDICHIQLAW